MPGVVTISATFGAGGSRIGPRVAKELGLPFLDRAIPPTVAARLQLSEEAAEALDERAPSLMERLAAALAHAAVPVGPEAVDLSAEDPERFREATEAVLREAASTTGAVVLGRCGMVVLRDHPGVCCVRLDGPVEARVARVAASEGLSPEQAATAQRHSDRARDAYAKVFYRVHPGDPRLYHLVLDTTAIDEDAAVELVVRAARARFQAAGNS
ncbi:AAA family ATPase [Aciditerrimonas ferrireducens]|uniref:AAA family ATPase n=1 Tax=Aciditerrimonas ferrireducens TaxID=667306 RepID=A0ABV6C3S9_9ACTN|nr:cytidylate kinase-like family protein [Aciditerrimonas ferrireducens]MCK4177366.1 cytidylate kinase-like family protein [Aciditerrimonas ferrireducens]